GRGYEDNSLVGLETVHLDQQLIEGLLALVVAASETGAAMAPDRVDLIDEDDAGGVLLALHEQVAHARGADADEHLDEIGPGNREERDAGFTGDGPGEQGLAGSRRSNQKDALGDTATEASESLRIAQKLDYLLEFILGLVDTSHVRECHLVGVFGEQLGAALSERHRLAAAYLHLAHEEDPQCGENEHREPLHQRDHPPRISFGGLRSDVYVFVAKGLYDVRIVGSVGLEMLAAVGFALDQVALDRDRLDLALVDLIEEVREDYLRFTRVLSAEDIEQQQKHQAQNEPESDAAGKLVHSLHKKRITPINSRAIISMAIRAHVEPLL